LRSEGWEYARIAQALRIRVETVNQHLCDYVESKKLKPENGGSKSSLDAVQTAELIAYLEEETYVKVVEICGLLAVSCG
jgi:hypothetical protein